MSKRSQLASTTETEQLDNLSRIKTIGFTRAGCWKLSKAGLAFELGEFGSARNVLYAFVVVDELVYIGKTVQSLRSRMSGYKTPGPTQSTNVKNHARIRDCLAQGKSVEIFALPDNGLQTYGGLHVNLAAGLEDSLARDLEPSWNGGQKESPNLPLQSIEPE